MSTFTCPPATALMPIAILWFRRDLRLSDQPALAAALRAGYRIVPLYVHAPDEESPWPPGAASRWWLHHSLLALDGQLRSLGSRLLLRSGDSLAQIEQVVETTGAEAVYWNRRYEPAVIDRDERIKRTLRQRGLHVESHNGALLVEPWQVQTGQGDPYKVFTPFWRNARERIGPVEPLPEPQHLSPPPESLATESLASWQLRPEHPWDAGIHGHWQPGTAGARSRLQRFLDAAIASYREQRDRPDHEGTSKLSPHLHFGELSPRQVLAAIEAAVVDGSEGWRDNADCYVRELGWREFSHHLLYHFPDSAQAPLNARFKDFPWRDDARALSAWRRGRTGIPIVDAGMRELWHRGWMHNRVRMIVASLLTKNLGQHWLHGARWFWDTLVDADLANNTQGWQWSAGCGADAAPYFRIFNPVAQGERFDPDGAYVTAWLPELARLPAKWRQQPWLAPAAVLDSAGVPVGSVYRRPIVDLRRSRERALADYASTRRPGQSGPLQR